MCDSVTGECECFPGIRGRLCDQCEYRYVVQGGYCVPCDVECTGTLFSELDTLEDDLIAANITAEKFLPWKKVSDLTEGIEEVKKLDKIVVKEMPNMDELKGNVTELVNLATKLKGETDRVVSSYDQGAAVNDTNVRRAAEEVLYDLERDLSDLRSFVEPIVESIVGR